MKRILSLFLLVLLVLTVSHVVLASGACPATKTGQHAWTDWTTTREPTCTAAGECSRQCAACSQTETDVIPALGHAEVTDPSVAPTCTETGLTEGKHCSRCGEVITAQVSIPATGHTIMAIEGWAATCTEAGLTDGTKCSVCGAILSPQEPIPANGHTIRIVSGRAATCTEDGLTDEQTCSVCGAVIRAQERIPASGHAWSDWKTLQAATCTEGGIRTHTCTVCGAEETQSTDALDHDWSSVVTQAPTCTAEGVKTYTCKRCGIVSTEVLSLVDHTPVVVPAQAPTCTETGLTEGLVCSVCGEVFTAQQTVPATGHNPVTVPGKAPTCTEAGFTEGSNCFVCGEILTAQEVIAATGHRWNDGVVTTEPSGFTPGVKTFTCTVCGDTRTEPVDPTGALFDRIRGVTPRSPETDPLRITEQPSDGYASRMQGNYQWQYLKVVAEGGQPPYTYQWYYKPLFSSLGSGLTGSTISELISSKVTSFADTVNRVKDRTRTTSSKVMDSWLAAHEISGVSISHADTSLNGSGWGGRAIEGATKDNYEAHTIGQYYCVVTDDQGRHVASEMAKVTQGVYITEQPENASLFGKTSVELHCAAAGGSGTYEFFLVNKEYNGEGEGDDDMSVSRYIGTEASIPVKQPGTYYFWVDNLVADGTNGTCTSRTVTVTGEPLTEQPDVPAPGTNTTGTTYQVSEADMALTGDWFTAYEGMTFQITLNADGTYAASFPTQPDSQQTGTWVRADNAIYLDGSAFPDMILEGDEARCTAFDGVLHREQSETYAPAKVQADAPLESFAGHWQARYAAVEGTILNADAIEGPVDVLIDSTDVALGGDIFGDAIVAMTYDNGTLSLSQDGVTIALQLQTDSFLRLTLSADAETMTIYLQSAETGD